MFLFYFTWETLAHRLNIPPTGPRTGTEEFDRPGNLQHFLPKLQYKNLSLSTPKPFLMSRTNCHLVVSFSIFDPIWTAHKKLGNFFQSSIFLSFITVCIKLFINATLKFSSLKYYLVCNDVMLLYLATWMRKRQSHKSNVPKLTLSVLNSQQVMINNQAVEPISVALQSTVEFVRYKVADSDVM